MNSSEQDAATSGKFCHKPLPNSASWIRLLKLYPAWSKQPVPDASEHSPADGFNEPLQCSILPIPLDLETAPAQPYKALSYCWGPDIKTHHILIEGATLGITSSLDSALRHLRQRSEPEPTIIWIDQICINQADGDEKGDQVRMMALVYGKAEQVIVWLGAAEQGSDEAMDFYDKIGREICDQGLCQYCNRDGLPTLDTAVYEKHPKNKLWRKYDKVRAKAFDLLLPSLEAIRIWAQRPWFGRVWVIQEFSIGPNPLFVCGKKSVEADFIKTTHVIVGLGITHDFLNAVRANLGDEKVKLVGDFIAQDPMPAFFKNRARRQRRLNNDKVSGDTMFELLQRTYVGRDARATLPVDRIFSLWGLATDAKRLGVEVDYKKTPAQVFTGLARALLNSGNMAVLAYAQHESPGDVSGIPSWVPDWRPKLRPSFYAYPPAGLEHEHIFNPSAGKSPKVVSEQDSAVLHLTGFVVDTIETVGSVWSDDDNADPYRHQGCLEDVRHFCRLSATKNKPIYATADRRSEAGWRVPIADIWEANEPGGQQRPTERAKRALADFDRLIAWHRLPVHLRLSTPEPDDGEPSMYRMSMSRTSGMCPVMTNEGYIGMGPPHTQPGDLMVVFLGSRVCSVVRTDSHLKFGQSSKQFLYIGEAYCDGIMGGELVPKRLDEVFSLI